MSNLALSELLETYVQMCGKEFGLTGGVVQVVERLPKKHESSASKTTTKKSFDAL
jgi:hypothetical protein